MNRVGLPFMLALAGGLLMPAVASSQTLVDQTFAAADGATVVAEAEQRRTAAEQLRPATGTATLFSPMSAEIPAGDYRQVEIDDDGDKDGVPYMIAGGIAFLAGAIVGDDVGTILMLGGAGAGAYGAFVYFGGD